MKICFATNNQQKIYEVAEMLHSNDIEILSLKDIGCDEELPETTGTIEGNSKQKAEYVFNHYQVDCFADDTGLEVEALNGAPGVDSAHYSGSRDSEANMNLLLNHLKGKENRNARFRTVITLVRHTGIQSFEGIVNGVILEEKRGSGGFGYDPIFQPGGYQHSFAELSRQEKGRISHRGLATNKLIQYLKSLTRQ